MQEPPTETINDQRVITWERKATAWGRLIGHSSIYQPLRAAGQFEDSESGLYYNRYRYYSAELAAYLTPDPIGLHGGLNLTAFAPNPAGWIDVLGLAKKPVDSSKVDTDCNGRFRDNRGRFARDPGWPPDRGFLNGKSGPLVLHPGTVIDRYGYPGGTFVSPVGTKFEARALPKSYAQNKPYFVYRVEKSVTVTAGQAAPWFNQPGLGTQYELPKSAADLLKDGTLTDITPCQRN